MEPRDPSRHPRRILVCVTGLSPQIITETLYALAVQNEPAFLPDEIHLVTTVEGAERARLSLLDPEQGQFFRLCADYGLDPSRIRFDETTIHHIPSADGRPLDDIRSREDNAAAADAITALVRALTHDPQSIVHASIAGGRKTMGFFLGYAMSLFGRPQDRLSHVLISAPFESHPEFYFPPRKPRVLYTAPPNSRPIHTADAVVSLADIPFVRLRDSLDPTLLTGTANYSDTVQRAQASLEPVELVLDADSRRVRCGATILSLPPTEFAFLAWFARRALTRLPGLCRSGITAAETETFLSEYRDLPGAVAGQEYSRVEKALAKGMEHQHFDTYRSKLHRHLKEHLGPAGARPYLIESDHRRPRSRYALALEPEQIRFGNVDEQ